MQVQSSFLAIFLASSALALSACSSGGTNVSQAGTEAIVNTVGSGTNPTTATGPGGVEGSRNLILTEISYFHPAQGGAFDETYDIAATTLVVEYDRLQDTGIGTGAQFVESSQGSFGQNSSLTYDASADLLTFSVESGTVDYDESFQYVLLSDPAQRGLEFNDEMTIISSDPSDFPQLTAAQQAAFRGNPGATQAFLVSLSIAVLPVLEDIPAGATVAETTAILARNEIAENTAAAQTEANGRLLNDLQLAVVTLRDRSDFYSYTNSNGATYSHLNLRNSAISTNYSTVGLWNNGVGADLKQTFGVAVYGQRTPLQDIPQTGQIRYVGTTIGRLLQANTVESLRGGITFDFNFGTDSFNVDYLAQLVELDVDGNPMFFEFDRFTGQGAIADDRFAGSLTSVTDDTLTGNLDGAFFGISGEEASGTFVFSNGDVQGIGGFITVVEDTTLPDPPTPTVIGQ